MTATHLFRVLANDYPPPIPRLREQGSLKELATLSTFLEKFKRLRSVSSQFNSS